MASARPEAPSPFRAVSTSSASSARIPDREICRMFLPPPIRQALCDLGTYPLRLALGEFLFDLGIASGAIVRLASLKAI